MSSPLALGGTACAGLELHPAVPAPRRSAGAAQLPGAGRRPAEARLRPRVGRHRQPHRAHRPAAQGGGGEAGPALALLLAGGHVAKLEGCRQGRWCWGARTAGSLPVAESRPAVALRCVALRRAWMVPAWSACWSWPTLLPTRTLCPVSSPGPVTRRQPGADAGLVAGVPAALPALAAARVVLCAAAAHRERGLARASLGSLQATCPPWCLAACAWAPPPSPHAASSRRTLSRWRSLWTGVYVAPLRGGPSPQTTDLPPRGGEGAAQQRQQGL